jgi:hypothetical protein
MANFLADIWGRGLRRKDAARYVGVSPTKFDQLMPILSRARTRAGVGVGEDRGLMWALALDLGSGPLGALALRCCGSGRSRRGLHLYIQESRSS